MFKGRESRGEEMGVAVLSGRQTIRNNAYISRIVAFFKTTLRNTNIMRTLRLYSNFKLATE